MLKLSVSGSIVTVSLDVDTAKLVEANPNVPEREIHRAILHAMRTEIEEASRLVERGLVTPEAAEEMKAKMLADIEKSHESVLARVATLADLSKVAAGRDAELEAKAIEQVKSRIKGAPKRIG